MNFSIFYCCFSWSTCTLQPQIIFHATDDIGHLFCCYRKQFCSHTSHIHFFSHCFSAYFNLKKTKTKYSINFNSFIGTMVIRWCLMCGILNHRCVVEMIESVRHQMKYEFYRAHYKYIPFKMQLTCMANITKILNNRGQI